MHAPRDHHAAMLKHVLRYVKGTVELGLHLHASKQLMVTAYSDAD